MQNENGKSETEQLREIFAKPDKPKTKRKRPAQLKRVEPPLTDSQVEALATEVCVALSGSDERALRVLVVLIDEMTRTGGNQFTEYLVKRIAIGRCDDFTDRAAETFRREAKAGWLVDAIKTA